MKSLRLYKLFTGFYEQYLIPVLFIALTPALFYDRPLETAFALMAIMLGTLGDIAINRVYDADDDAIEAWKRKTNPISNGEISKDVSWMLCIGVYFFSIIFSILSGNSVFALAVAVRNLLGFLYSAPPVRAKSKPRIDVLFHITIIDSGPAFMALLYASNFSLISPIALYMLFFLIINSMFTQVSQELRDIEVDRKANLKTTVQVLGKNKSMILQKSLLSLLIIYSLAVGLHERMLYVAGTSAIGVLFLVQNIGKEDRAIHKTRGTVVGLIIAGALVQILSTL